MMPERITSKANPRVRALRSALQSRRGETVGIEGFHLVREAVASGLLLTTLYVRDDQAGVVNQLPSESAREVLILSREAFDSAAATEQAQGIAAVIERPTQTYLPRTGDLLLVADGVQDPGNLGTLIRSAEAFGASTVVLGQGTVDPWNGKCLRASAGAAFRLPLPRWNDELLKSLRAIDAKLYAAVAREGTLAHLIEFAETAVIIIGNEAAGVSDALLQACDDRITLATIGPTESLNAAVAGSLLLYEASQQRRFKGR
jgi:TrmH family RNA methyltransferase